ncbi:MAG: hypothetical protein R3Y67_00320 [Eubacteriales bacterium]
MKVSTKWNHVILLYVAGVIFYGLVATRITIPVHYGADEELYVALAKNFFYEGVFMKGYEALDYSCVLYSILLSGVYFFYDADSIVFLMRLLGVLLQVSSVFPVYYLGSRILGNHKKALGICALSLIIPEMMNSMYLMQEVLCYPLLLWGLVLLYLDQMEERYHRVTRYTILTILFMVLTYYTKTYAIVCVVSYCFYWFVAAIHHRTKAIWVKCITVVLVSAAFLMAGRILVAMPNVGLETANHYSTQIQNLFPITLETLWQIVYGLCFYGAFLLLCTGFFPVVMPLLHMEQFSLHHRRFLKQLLLVTAFLLVEVVVCILCTETQPFEYPNKFIYRYLYVVAVPYWILFAHLPSGQGKEKPIELDWRSNVLAIGMVGTMLIYYVGLPEEYPIGIMDGFLFLLIENMDRYIWHGFPIFLTLGIAVVLGATYLYGRKHAISYKKSFFRGVTLYCIVFLVINCIQLPYYHNVVAEGEVLEPQFVVIAEVVNEYDTIYYVSDSLDYKAAFYAYIQKDYQWISSAQLEVRLASSEVEEVIYIVNKEAWIAGDITGNLIKELPDYYVIR